MLWRVCCSPRYGADPESPRTIDLLIIAAHSDGDSLQLNGVRHLPRSLIQKEVPSEERSLTREDQELIRSWNSYLSLGSTALLVACSAFLRTGSNPTIGPLFESSLPNATVHGMRFPGNLADFHVDERGMLSRVFWSEGYTWF